MISRYSRRPAAVHHLLRAAAGLAVAGSAFAAQPGVYIGHDEQGYRVRIKVVEQGRKQFVTMFDSTTLITCHLSGEQILWRNIYLGASPVRPDGYVSLGVHAAGGYGGIRGRIDDKGEFLGFTREEDPMLTLEDPQRGEACIAGLQTVTAHLKDGDAPLDDEPSTTAEFVTTTRLDAQGRVLSRETVRTPRAEPAPAPSPAAGTAHAIEPGFYQGVNSQGRGLSFYVQDSSEGGLVINFFSDYQLMTCEESGHVISGADVVFDQEPVAPDGSFAFSYSTRRSHFDVTGAVNADGSVSGTSVEIMPALTNRQPQSGERCLPPAPLTWTATRVSESAVPTKPSHRATITR